MPKLYNQKKLWVSKWQDGKIKPVNGFAKKSFLEIEKHRGLKTLLDLGCGAGQDAVFFANKGMRVAAVDFLRPESAWSQRT